MEYWQYLLPHLLRWPRQYSIRDRYFHEFYSLFFEAVFGWHQKLWSSLSKELRDLKVIEFVGANKRTAFQILSMNDFRSVVCGTADYFTFESLVREWMSELHNVYSRMDNSVKSLEISISAKTALESHVQELKSNAELKENAHKAEIQDLKQWLYLIDVCKLEQEPSSPEDPAYSVDRDRRSIQKLTLQSINLVKDEEEKKWTKKLEDVERKCNESLAAAKCTHEKELSVLLSQIALAESHNKSFKEMADYAIQSLLPSMDTNYVMSDKVKQ